MTTSIIPPHYTISQQPDVGSKKPVQLAGPSSHYDLISFLGLMQQLGVDLLPIKWQPALESLGVGGSANIPQALLNASTSFAFKRLLIDGVDVETCFERLAKEAFILRHVSLIHHKYLIRLEAYCCEILKKPERILPVLIFEKFPLGNLQDYLLSEATVNITFTERLSFCADIADALSALHGLCWFGHGLGPSK